MSIHELVAYKVKRGKIAEVTWHVIEDFCKGCGFCIEFCPVNALEQSDKINAKRVHPPKMKDESICVGCGLCERVCPELAIYLERKGESEKQNG